VVRDRLGLKPGDTLRYRLTDAGVLLGKAAANETDDPFAAFTEWWDENAACRRRFLFIPSDRADSPIVSREN
jgi:hypothetical protein